MKKALFFTAILSCLLLTSSCQKDQIDATPRLELDTQQAIQMESVSSEKVIPVRANLQDWAVSTDASWLTARKVGCNLVINAESNETLVPREAKVVVTSRDITKAFVVRQSGYPTLIVETDPAEVTFSQDAGQIRLVLKTNATDWTISSTADWLSVTAQLEQEALIVKVEANGTPDARTANLIVHSGGHRHTILVKQAEPLHFFLPHNRWGEDFSSIQQLERMRHSRLKTSPNANTNPRIPDFIFSTVSRAFSEVKYEFEDYGKRTLYATTLVGSQDVVYSSAFHQYLISQGFERISSPLQKSGQLEFVNRKQKTELYIYALRDTQTRQVRGVVFCRPIHDQPEPMPTLDHLELGVGGLGKTTEAEVERWEKAHSGAFDNEFADLIGAPFFFAPEPFYGRGYFYQGASSSSRVISGYVFLYTRHTWGIYRYGGMDYLTSEFKQLLEREGFEFLSYSPHARAYAYRHRHKGVSLAIRSMEVGRYRMLRININPLNN
ncbi:MAG: BACON domain-containing protein [Porphyromonadaceae bacterium]|nr:BACON domain-containing protein [Porphyromonadaceae bacterium]